MAKNNNLTDFLTDVADAIREKTGTSEPINPQDFSDTIKSIQTGGATSKPSNDVDFCDYDGTILHSYTKDEFLALTELPPLPEQEGLICEGWNWELADAQEYVGKYDGLIVGANYITDNGATRLYINTMWQDNVTLFFYSFKGDIDWGDGVRETKDLSGNVSVSHKYSKSGKYVISLFSTSTSSKLYYNSGTTGLFGSASDNYNTILLEKAEIGASVLIDYYAFINCRSLQSISIPRYLASDFDNFAPGVFKTCNSLRFLVIPPESKGLGQYIFESCLTLQGVSFPKTMTATSNQIFYYCYNLRKIYLSDSFTSIESSFLAYTYKLEFFKVPSSVISIGSNAFSNCGARYIDFSNHTSVPSLSATSAFNGPSKTKIIVPDSLYDEWVAATNWSSITSKIIKKSEWDALNV